MGHVDNLVRDGLTSFVEVARQELNIAPPYNLEIGFVGLANMLVSVPQSQMQYANEVTGPIYENEFHYPAVLNDFSVDVVQKVRLEFLRGLYDLAGVKF